MNQKPLIIRPNGDLIEQYPSLVHNSQAIARGYANKRLVTEDVLQQMGQQLWQTVESDFSRAFDEAREQAGQSTLSIIIESDVPKIQQLPWETLYHPEQGFLGKQNGFTLSRQTLSAAEIQLPALESGPLRVLLFTALPDDLTETGRLDVEEEQAQVLEALLPWIQAGIIELEMPDDGRFATLQELLRTFRPHLLFLSGHGKFHEEIKHSDQPPAPSPQPSYATFLFEGSHGQGDHVRDATLAQAFLGTPLHCVILSACESGQMASDALNQGLAWQLHQTGIPYVIGMRESVLDRAGIQFARQFCDSVARKTGVAVALQQARQAMTQPLKDSPELADDRSGVAKLSLGQWSLPMLLAYDVARPLIQWDFTPQPPQRLRYNQTLNSIILPPRFIGRRKELRQLSSQPWQRVGRGRRRWRVSWPSISGEQAIGCSLGLRGQKIRGKNF